MKIIYKYYILLCFHVLFLQSCGTYLTSKQSEYKKKHCFLKSYPLEECNILINNLMNTHIEIQQFMADTCDYSLVFSKGNSIIYFSINHSSCICYSNNKIEDNKLISESILCIEYLASLKIAHIQKEDNSTLIFSNELPLLVLIKKNGVLSYCFIGLSGCDLHMDSDNVMIVNKIYSITNSVSLLCTPPASPQ
jgi:hypothetical protein